MAYDEGLAERIRGALAGRDAVTERKMFGGVGWMVGGNMACGIVGGDGLLVRLGHEDAERALADADVGPFQMGSSRPPSRGFVVVAPAGVADDAALARWVDAGAAYAASLPPK